MLSKQTEERIYQAVLDGELRIDPDGSIWRVAFRQGRGRGGGTRVVPCEPRRAENRIPLGYLQVRAMFDWHRYHGMAHRLVYRHFKGPIPPGLTVNHRNGVKDDNRPENLELATAAEQLEHARTVLGHPNPFADQDGEANRQSRLTAADVRTIRARCAAGEVQAAVAIDFGIVHQTVSQIVRRKRWASVV